MGSEASTYAQAHADSDLLTLTSYTIIDYRYRFVLLENNLKFEEYLFAGMPARAAMSAGKLKDIVL